MTFQTFYTKIVDTSYTIQRKSCSRDIKFLNSESLNPSLKNRKNSISKTKLAKDRITIRPLILKTNSQRRTIQQVRIIKTKPILIIN